MYGCVRAQPASRATGVPTYIPQASRSRRKKDVRWIKEHNLGLDIGTIWLFG